MKRLYLYISCILLSFTGCTTEDFRAITSPDQNEFARVDGDKVIVNMTIDVPELADIQTRTLDEKPTYQDMHLYLVEFADNGNPLQNTYITTYEPVEGSEASVDDKVNYKVVLNATSKSRILHLIVLPKDQDLNIEYGIEASVIPNLKTGSQTPAYWRRLEFREGYATQDAQGKVIATKALAKLEHVALVRNFARITMTNNAEGFELKGFAIINNPQSGSIAPWNSSTSSFPEFLDLNQTQKVYTTIAAEYSGFAPEGLTLGNTDAGPVVEDDLTAKYMYERPFNSIHHTYVILKGRRATDNEDSYYKLDIGKNDSQGVFRYFGLLRNFSYNISINKVGQKGYSTAAAAASGVVYNNFSFDIELSSMLNLSDGEEIVFVNFTTKVLTEPTSQTIEFKYRYKTKEDGFQNTPTFNGGPVNFIGLEKGSVIDEITYSDNDDEYGWRSVLIKCYPAQTETKTQSFIIVKPSGLGRTINLILHRKWTLQNVKLFSKALENWDSTTEDEGEVGDAVGSDFTIFFDLPDNLEEAMFPLVFTLEADRQNMENNPLGALVVTSGPSGFSGVQGNRIKYEKSVSWTQYNDPLNENDPYDNGTAIPNGDGTYTHRVRCRFRTTTDLENLPFEESKTKVRITNENFNVATTEFHRAQ